MKTHYDHEEKDRLNGYFSEEKAANIRWLLSESRFHVLKASLWHCSKGWEVPERRISDNLVLIVGSGSIDVTVNGAAAILKRGAGAVIPERLPHSYRLAGTCEKASLFILHAMPILDVLDNPFQWFDSPFWHSEEPEALLRKLHRCVAMRLIDNDCAMSDACHILNELLLEFAERGMFHCRKPLCGDPRIAEACRFFDTYLAQDISVTDAAEKINLHEAQFRRIFRKETGLSPNEYLHRIRLQHAVRLLIRYPMKLNEIASASGFHSVSYFCSSFLRVFGRSPNRFRRNYL